MALPPPPFGECVPERSYQRVMKWPLGTAFVAFALTVALPRASLAGDLGRVGFYSLAATGKATAAVAQIVPYASDLLRPLLGAAFVPVNAHGATDREIAAACRDARVNAILVFFYRAGSVTDGSSRHDVAEAHIDLFDCFGDIVFDGAGSAEGDATLGKLATDRAFSAFRSATNERPSTLANVVRYGLPLADGERSAGLSLVAGALGARARVSAFGTAAAAGIADDDVVTTLDGESLAGQTNARLAQIVANVETAGGRYDATVVRSDGTSVRRTFVSKDLAAYLHDLAPK